MQSLLGYKDNSPYRYNPYNIINTPRGLITMDGVSTPLIAVSELGERKYLPPNSGLHRFKGKKILEIPVMQNGGGVIQPKPRKGVRKNPDGTESTHLMTYTSADGKWYAYPTLFQKEDGTWYELSDKNDWEAFKEAQRLNEIYEFGTEEEAKQFSKGSWKNKFQTGGNVDFNRFLQQFGVTPVSTRSPSDNTTQVIRTPSGTKVLATPSTPVLTPEQHNENVKRKKEADAREIQRRKDNILRSNSSKGFMEGARNSALGDKMRLFPNDPDSFIDEWINPLKWVGDMADNLGHTIGNPNSTVGDYAFAVGTPVAGGLIGKFGARNTRQWANNLVNPFAGINIRPRRPIAATPPLSTIPEPTTPLVSTLDDLTLDNLPNLIGEPIGTTGANNYGLYPLLTLPDHILKLEDPSKFASIFSPDYLTQDLSQLMASLPDDKQISKVVKQFDVVDNEIKKKLLRKLPNEIGDFERFWVNRPLRGYIMPKLPSRGLSKLSPRELRRLPESFYTQLFDNLKTIRNNNLGFDFFGLDNLGVTANKTPVMYDVSPFPAKDGFWSEEIAKVDPKLPREESAKQIEEAIRALIVENYHNTAARTFFNSGYDASKSMKIKNMGAKQIDNAIKKYLHGRDPYRFGGKYLPIKQVGGGMGLTAADRQMQRTLVPNNYGIYSGVVNQKGKSKTVPTELDAINTMIDYMKNNQSDQSDNPSNIYRPQFRHYGVNYVEKPLTFAQEGGTIPPKKGTTNPPIYVSDPRDPRLRAYNDSLNLYKAYQFQKNNFAVPYQQWLNDVGKNYPGGPEALKQAREKNIGVPGTKISNEKSSEFKPIIPDSQYDPPYSGDNKIINYYKSLIGSDKNYRIGVHNSPDLWHKDIKSIGMYYDGAESPIYKQPVQPVIFQKKKPWTEYKSPTAQLLSRDRISNPDIVSTPQERLNIPLVRPYTVDYFDPELKQRTSRLFESDKEGAQFMKDLDPVTGLEQYRNRGDYEVRGYYQQGGTTPCFKCGGLKKYQWGDVTPPECPKGFIWNDTLKNCVEEASSIFGLNTKLFRGSFLPKIPVTQSETLTTQSEALKTKEASIPNYYPEPIRTSTRDLILGANVGLRGLSENFARNQQDQYYYNQLQNDFNPTFSQAQNDYGMDPDLQVGLTRFQDGGEVDFDDPNFDAFSYLFEGEDILEEEETTQSEEEVSEDKRAKRKARRAEQNRLNLDMALEDSTNPFKVDLMSIKEAIGEVESAGDYGAIGKTPVSSGMYAGERALGKYQIMPTNLKSWSREVVGREVSPQEFLSNPELQERIATAKMTEIGNQYGVQNIPAVWLTGQPLGKSSAKDDNGTNAVSYTEKVFNKIGDIMDRFQLGGSVMTTTRYRPSK